MASAPAPSSLRTVKVAGVPEHFNTPWELAIANGSFAREGINVEFSLYPGGTGAMTAALRNGTVDMAVALTEGLIADIALKGSDDYIIVAPYVSVPLRWGIWGSPTSTFTESELKGKTFGISRFGSGSHIMSTVLAVNKGWSASDIKFGDPAGGLPNLLAGIQNGTTDAFLWNYETTKPLMDEGKLRHIGDLYTPWPCFMIAVRQAMIRDARADVKTVLKVIKVACQEFLANRESSIEYVVSKHKIQEEDVREWFSTLGYAQSDLIGDEVLASAIRALRASQLITYDPVRSQLVLEGGGEIPNSDWLYIPTPEEEFSGIICPALSPSVARKAGSSEWPSYAPSQEAFPDWL